MSPKVESMELAKIKPFEYYDILTRQQIGIRVTPYYSILAIDGRQYYFIKETGEFDGTSIFIQEKEN